MWWWLPISKKTNNMYNEKLFEIQMDRQYEWLSDLSITIVEKGKPQNKK